MEKLHFKVESPANFVKLACTILFERKEELLDDYGSTWHDVFDGEAGDQHFQRFMISIHALREEGERSNF